MTSIRARFQPRALVLVTLVTLAGPARGAGDEVTLPRARPLTDRTYEATPERLERGARLMSLMRCVLCHSDRDLELPGAPPVEGFEFAGSVFFEGGDLRLVAPNITPDEETGIGGLTDDMIARALREGVGHDGRALGFMPWEAFRSLSDEDLAAVVVALRAVPPVRRELPPTHLAPQVMEMLEQLPHPLEGPVPERDLSDPVARGTYLVDVADCMGCHTVPESPLTPGEGGGGRFAEDWRLPGEGAFSTNLTPAPSGIPYYTEELFLEALRTGEVVARKLHPAMPWVEYGRLPDEDLAAIFAALRTLRPVDHNVANAEAPTPCAACGGQHGGGEWNRPREIVSVPRSAGELADLAGTYRFDNGLEAVLRVEDGRLVMGSLFGDLGPLSALEDGTFDAPGLPAPLRFERDGDGEVVGLVSLELSPAPAEKLAAP